MLRFPDETGPWLVSQLAAMLSTDENTVSEEFIRREIRAGNLRAQARRGTQKPVYITKEAFDEWKESCFG